MRKNPERTVHRSDRDRRKNARAKTSKGPKTSKAVQKARGRIAPTAHLNIVGGTLSGPVKYGLGSLDTNYNTISKIPVYTKGFPAGGRPYPPVVGFDPAVVTATGVAPAQQQPLVANGFNQVPQSSKWWSGLMFPRTKVAATDKNTPQDSQRDQLFALNAGPFTGMVNSNIKGKKADFAGLGLSYLSPSALFVQPSKPYNDPPPPFVPVGQPQAWANPQAPGAERWQYRYDGNGNPREYQDFSVGLKNVQADGKVLSYSDSTVTLDWQGTNDTTKAPEELQATMGEGLPFVYFTLPKEKKAKETAIQLVTTPKNNFDLATNKPVDVPVKVTAYNSKGEKVTGGAGTGAFELEESYSLHDVLDNITQTAGTTDGKDTILVQDSTSLAVGMSVEGPGIKAGAKITGIVDGTHVNIGPAPMATKRRST